MSSPRPTRPLALGTAGVSVAVCVASLFALGCPKTPPAVTTPAKPAAEAAELSGSGATFVEPIMKLWTGEYLKETGDKVRVSYAGVGSGAGIKNLTEKNSDFGCSDAPMNEAQLKLTKAPVVHVPVVVGAVVPMYNLEAVPKDKPLTFTGPVLADIFTGKITKWNDPKLAELNPGIPLPDLGILPVFRSDASGTSFVFSTYLAKLSPEFKTTVGASNDPKWPAGLGVKQKGSDQVAGHVTKNNGAIGYIELTYALDTKAQYGKVRNKAGKDILGTLDSMTAAGAASLGKKATNPPYSLHELTYDLTDADGDSSYPISTLSFAILYADQTAAGVKGRALVQFLKWVTSPDGQAAAKSKNYAPLPEGLQKQIAEALDKVTVEK